MVICANVKSIYDKMRKQFAYIVLVREREQALSGLPRVSDSSSEQLDRGDAYVEWIWRLARIALLLWHDLAGVGQTVRLVESCAVDRALIHALVEQVLVD